MKVWQLIKEYRKGTLKDHPCLEQIKKVSTASLISRGMSNYIYELHNDGIPEEELNMLEDSYKMLQIEERIANAALHVALENFIQNNK
jgi:hypothetical protein